MKEQNIFLDIGGGTHPDFFMKMANQDPLCRYIAIDPTIRNVEDKPNNISLMQWYIRGGICLPIRSESITGIFINNIFDELRTDNVALDWRDTEKVFDLGYYDSPEINHPDTQLSLYKNIIRECRRVLKSNGTISITDTHENICQIHCLCRELEFSTVIEPHLVTDPNKSIWTAWFYDIYNQIDTADGKLDVAPTELVLSVSH